MSTDAGTGHTTPADWERDREAWNLPHPKPPVQRPGEDGSAVRVAVGKEIDLRRGPDGVRSREPR